MPKVEQQNFISHNFYSFIDGNPQVFFPILFKEVDNIKNKIKLSLLGQLTAYFRIEYCSSYALNGLH